MDGENLPFTVSYKSQMSVCLPFLFPYLTSRRQNPHTLKDGAVKTSIHMGVCPKGPSQVYVG